MGDAGACQTKNMGDYEDEEEKEKESIPLDEVRDIDDDDDDDEKQWWLWWL